MKQYILKTLPHDGKAYEGFQWALEVGATVKAPDWNPEPKCGGGLHGWLKGEGNGRIGHIEREGCLWLVLETEQVVNIDNEKVKFPECKILFVGGRIDATKLLRSLCPDAQAIIGESIEVGDSQKCLVGDYGQATAGNFGQATAGDYGQATAGDGGQATAGNFGQATAGDNGKATAGEYGQATAGNNGQATAGDFGQATAGNKGQATAGEGGQATAGDRGQATAGDFGQATAGDRGQATAGEYGQATAGYEGQATAGYEGQATAGEYGKATAGEGGTIQIEYYNNGRYRQLVGYIGEDGLEPNVTYKIEDGKFVKA